MSNPPPNLDAAGPKPGEQKLDVQVYHNQQSVFRDVVPIPLGIGRQKAGEPDPYHVLASEGESRLVIANLAEVGLSRQHALVEFVDKNRLRVTNQSAATPVIINSNQSIGPGESEVANLPVVLGIGDRSLRFTAILEQASDFRSLDHMTLGPGQRRKSSLQFQDIVKGQMDGEDMVKWLEGTMSVFQLAASSPTFLEETVEAVLNTVQHDRAAVLLWEENQWKIRAAGTRQGRPPPSEWRPSMTILECVREQKRTYHKLPGAMELSASLSPVAALVAAPILDAKGEVIGALYADRGHMRGRDVPSVARLEAMLVELLACGVAAGMSRLEQEKAAVKARVAFEQFFSPTLAQQLELEPNLLDGKDTEITVLFCDIRGFSSISEKLGPPATVEWINDVWDELSECVIEHGGVLVDYVGDELFAMWGAPVQHPNHTGLACRSALEMLSKLNGINARWESRLGVAMRIGIGINSGIARVGNTGSQRKFKYGPLGNTVNLASRVQGATKQVKTPCLITEHTASHLTDDYARRRICRVRVVNIEEPVSLYELTHEPSGQWYSLRERYEMALEAYESSQFLVATKELGSLVSDFPDDGPSQLLLSRAVNCLVQPDEPFDPIWNLTSK